MKNQQQKQKQNFTLVGFMHHFMKGFIAVFMPKFIMVPTAMDAIKISI